MFNQITKLCPKSQQSKKETKVENLDLKLGPELWERGSNKTCLKKTIEQSITVKSGWKQNLHQKTRWVQIKSPKNNKYGQASTEQHSFRHPQSPLYPKFWDFLGKANYTLARTEGWNITSDALSSTAAVSECEGDGSE